MTCSMLLTFCLIINSYWQDQLRLQFYKLTTVYDYVYFFFRSHNCFLCTLFWLYIDYFWSVLTTASSVFRALAESTKLHALRAHVPCVLTCSHAIVPRVLTCLACLRAHMPACLACSRTNVLCVFTCSALNMLRFPICQGSKFA